MGGSQLVSAIVVGHTDYGESDRILRLVTPERGRVSALARGARKSKKRFGGTLDLGNRVDLTLTAGRGKLPLVTQSDLVRGTGHVRDSLEGLALLPYLCEWVSALAQVDHPEPKLFGVLDVALAVLDAATAPPTAVFRWGLEAKALTFAGLTPVLTACAACSEPLDDPAVYQPSAGGVLHLDCGVGIDLSPGWWTQAEHARRTPLADLVDTNPVGILGTWALHSHLEWHTGRGLRSQKLLAELGGPS
jgi:DNA repair protein RecO (recombination protein O)